MEQEIRRLRFEPELERTFRDEYARRRIPQFRLVFWVGLLIQIPISLRFALIEDIGPDDPRFWARLAVGVIPAVVGLRLLRSPARHGWLPGYMVFYVLLIGVVLTAIYAQTEAGWAALVVYYTAACIMSRLRAVEAALVEAVLIAWFAVYSLAVLDDPPGDVARGIFSLALISLFILVAAYLIEQSARRDFLLLRLLAEEREKSDRLLLNVLPAAIAERLKEAPTTIADSLDEVTVLFADIVGSTPQIARLPAETAVELLNEVVSSFDRLTEARGLEKIRTIGDSYMVVGGAPEPRPDHAEAVVSLALEMLQEIRRFRWPDGEPLQIRIGINTGPVVAGVIGTRKFSYDLWGDTVNVASRMESHGLPGTIQLTQAVYERLPPGRTATERTIDVKGKGPTLVYVLEPEAMAATPA